MKKISFQDNWLFSRNGEQAEPVLIPHDAMYEERRDENAPGGSASAFYYGGKYRYTKAFDGNAYVGKKVKLHFEGIYRNSMVTVNDRSFDGAAYGYSPFFLDITDVIRKGENIVTVDVDNSAQPDSRWYSGAGIYRPVWLWVGEGNCVEPEGIRVSTVSYDPAVIHVSVETNAPASETKVDILDGNTVIASFTGKNAQVEISDAKLWSAETPYLYTCRATTDSDTAEASFGIRKVEWSPEGLKVNGREVLLRGGCVHHDNGILGARCYDKSEERRVRIMKEAGYNAIRSAHNPCSEAMLRACDKLGMYLMDETWDMWYNHKNKFDYATDFAAAYKTDLSTLVSRDYNHPSVIMYSIANEISEPVTDKGLALEKEIVDCLHTLDSSRPVSAGINLMILTMAAKGQGVYKEEGGMNEKMSEKPQKEKKEKKPQLVGSLLFNMMTNMVGTNMNKMANSKKADQTVSPCLDALDIAGYNYASGRYPLERKVHPDRIVYGSETFPQDIAKNWEMVRKYPYLIGDFMWTAWDYLGEAGIGAWTYDPNSGGFNKSYPWLLADVGAIDILGNVGAPADYAACVWNVKKTPVIHVEPVNHSHEHAYKSTWRGTNARPSWSWKGCEGKKAVVEVYSNEAAKIALEINGERVGVKPVKEYKAVFKTTYKAGTITAIALDSVGKELSRSSRFSADGKLAIALRPEETEVPMGEIVYIPVSIDGENGAVESNADELISVSVDNGTLLAFGSALPMTTQRYTAGKYPTYYGQALAVVLCDRPGTVTVTARGETLQQAQAKVTVLS